MPNDHLNQSLTNQSVLLLKEGNPAQGRETVVKKDPQTSDTDHGHPILCRACKKNITSAGYKMSVNGSHDHTFFNPGGHLYVIGCFSNAACLHMDKPSLEFTWFPGHSWQICLCPSCHEHLGWHFSSSAKSSFYGLILDRLVEGQQKSS